MTDSRELLELVVGQIWQVTILCVVAGWLSRTALRESPTLKYYLGVIVLIKSVTPPILPSHCGVFSWLFQSLSTETSAWVSRFFGASLSPQQTALIAISVWMLGCLLSLCRTFVTWRRIQQKIASSTQPAPPQLIGQIEQLATKLGIRKTIRVAITAEPIGPAVIGIWKPLMILPLNVVSTKSAQELEPILAHELLHVRRGDTWVAVLETLVRACWWFHPSVQRAAEATSQAGELCCDQDVLRELLYAPRRYAESLLDVCEATCQLQPLVGSPGIRAEQVTRDRLKRIMTSRGSRPRQLLNMGLLILGLLIVLPGSSINTASPIDHSGSTTADKSLNNSPSATSNLAATIRDRLLN